MGEVKEALSAGDALAAELAGTSFIKDTRPAAAAPSMGRLKKVSYTHEAMIDLIIRESAKPGGISQRQLAAHFGYAESWISNILASDAFQAKLAARREEVVDPVLSATLRERFEALTRQSLDVLQDKLSKPTVSDTIALRAAELGAKALGMGGHAPAPVTAPPVDRLTQLAGRLLKLQEEVRERVVNGQVTEVVTTRTVAEAQVG